MKFGIENPIDLNNIKELSISYYTVFSRPKFVGYILFKKVILL